MHNFNDVPEKNKVEVRTYAEPCSDEYNIAGNDSFVHSQNSTEVPQLTNVVPSGSNCSYTNDKDPNGLLYEDADSILPSDKFTDGRYFKDNPKLEYVFIISVLLGQVFTQASSNVCLPLLQILSSHFDSDESQKTWYMSSFSLAQGTLILMSGRIGDIYGLKNAVMGGYLWTTIWSILAGVAGYVKTPTFFIVCRAMQGAGLAFVLPNVMGAAGRVYKPGSRRKHMVFSLIGLSAPLGGALGPIVAGWIATETTQWEWVFYHYAIGLAITMGISWWSIPYIKPHGALTGTKVSVDWIGCTIGVCSLVLFNFVWNQAPAAGWNSAYIIVLLIVSLVMMGFFFFYEGRYPSNPLVPKIVTTETKLILTPLVLFFSWGSFGILFFRFFIFVQELRNYNPIQSAACLTPVLVSGTSAAMVCGLLISRIKAQFLLVFSMVIFMCSDVMLLEMPIHQSYFQISMGIWILGVWGMDWSFPAGSIILSDGLPAQFQGMAGSLLTTMIMYGMSLFLGIAGTIESQILKRHPGDILAAHKACMYFAIGLSSTAIVLSIILALLTINKKDDASTSSISEGSERKEDLEWSPDSNAITTISSPQQHMSSMEHT